MARRDLNQIAASIVANSTAELPLKNAAAVELEKLGGKKGGAARAKALSATRRREIARNAASARWIKKRTARKVRVH